MNLCSSVDGFVEKSALHLDPGQEPSLFDEEIVSARRQEALKVDRVGNVLPHVGSDIWCQFAKPLAVVVHQPDAAENQVRLALAKVGGEFVTLDPVFRESVGHDLQERFGSLKGGSGKEKVVHGPGQQIVMLRSELAQVRLHHLAQVDVAQGR